MFVKRQVFSIGRRWGSSASMQGFRRTSTSMQSSPNNPTEVEAAELEDSKVPVSVSLSLSGGNDGEQERRAQTERMRKELKRLKLPEFAKLNPDDIMWVNKDMTFVGTGSETNINGVRHALSHDVFKTTSLVTVRDVFERSPQRPTLKDSFKLVSDDVTAMLSDIQRGPRRRLCNEYVRDRSGGKDYKLWSHDVDFIEYLHEKGFRIVPVDTTQSTNHVMMVAPTAFAVNEDAAQDNHFMSADKFNDAEKLRKKVIREFEALHAKLTDKTVGAGLRVHLFTHEPFHDTPDAVFPNNWFSTHTDLEVGECTLCLYPMKALNRRKERRPDFIDRLHSFSRYTNVIDFTRQESAAKPKFLEGTGSLVLDRINRIAYAAISERTEITIAQMWARAMGYTLVPFVATDHSHRPIYHTNVMMSIGTSVAIICLESITNATERASVVNSLQSTGHTIVDISLAQVDKFCGNVLEVENYYGKPVLTMSTQAHDAFTPEQREVLLDNEEALVHADISTLEQVGGGGVRCSIGELF